MTRACLTAVGPSVESSVSPTQDNASRGSEGSTRPNTQGLYLCRTRSQIREARTPWSPIRKSHHRHRRWRWGGLGQLRPGNRIRVEKLTSQFAKLLGDFDLSSLRAHSGAVYGVWSDFRLAYLNPAWFRFAHENGGEPSVSRHWRLGASILDGIASPVREFYQAKYRHALRSHTVWNHEYECSSDTLYRLLHQIVYPLGSAEGLLVVNSVRVERAHSQTERPARPADDAIYRDKQGRLHQCAHCRRVKNLLELERWDWVPEWVRVVPPPVSHRLCPSCVAHYYAPAANG